PVEEGFEVHREGGTWVVKGRTAERAVALSDLTVPAAAATAARRLALLGVEDALRAAGARSGDPVRIGDLIFEFQEEEQAQDPS
ncbi:MAG TPA: Obg family GTPase CgtA, partial [Acidimicrobiia bacterium]